MQLQFHKTLCPCLQRIKRQVQNQEQTQEIRLGDDMPDIGRVLGAWGQVLMRSKEWRSGAMSVSGGVKAWVLYAPEDGGQVCWTDAWIPFQMKWDLPETQHDGVIRTHCLLRGIDARSTSARRLMVRVSIGAMGEAMLPGEFAQYTPEELPEDVELLRNTYPFLLPQEAGEKPFQIEEMLTLPPDAPKIAKLIRYEMTPQILDKKVMGSKVVFRGGANLHLVYLTENGAVQSWDLEMPFSQYGELEGDYEPDATAELTPAVTSLEMDLVEDGNLQLKAGLTCQYVISNRNMITVVEDAYSPLREVTVETQLQQVPVILQQHTQIIHAQKAFEWEVGQVADVAFYPDHPRMHQSDDGVEMEIPGQFSVLYYDENGNLQGSSARWDGSMGLSADSDSQINAQIAYDGKAQKEMQADIMMEIMGCARQGVLMVTQLQLGEMHQKDPNRPSLILRKVGNEKLWDIAKRTGSTVVAISQANKLTEEPEREKILLIPVT